MRTWVYRGLRTADGQTVVVETYEQGAGKSFAYIGTEVLPPRNDIRDHSPDGFNWGYGGSGPAQLALAILAHASGGDHVPPRLYQSFKFAVIGRLGGDQWQLGHAEVMQWCYNYLAHDLDSDRPPTETEGIDLAKGPAEGFTGGEA